MGGWKSGIRRAICAAYRHSGAMRLQEAAARALGQRFLTIVLFHRVTDAIPEDGLTVSTARFRRICELLARRFRVVPLAEVFRLHRAGGDWPRRTVAVTFDDSYRDNLDASFVLREYGLPATFFVPTGYVGTERRFEWDRHLPPLPNLSWADVRAMADAGFEIGSHTVNHADLGSVGAEEARAELVESRQELQDRLGRPVRWLAYPFGGRHNLRPEYLPLITEAGYEGAVSAYGGFVTPRADGRVLPREAMPYFQEMAHLEMHLSGCLHWLYRLRGRDAAGDPWATAARPETEDVDEPCAPAAR